MQIQDKANNSNSCDAQMTERRDCIHDISPAGCINLEYVQICMCKYMSICVFIYGCATLDQDSVRLGKDSFLSLFYEKECNYVKVNVHKIVLFLHFSFPHFLIIHCPLRLFSCPYLNVPLARCILIIIKGCDRLQAHVRTHYSQETAYVNKRHIQMRTLIP